MKREQPINIAQRFLSTLLILIFISGMSPPALAVQDGDNMFNIDIVNNTDPSNSDEGEVESNEVLISEGVSLTSSSLSGKRAGWMWPAGGICSLLL